jgi:ubiquinone/menaquinone biosynthesis C-methylase UbiE
LRSGALSRNRKQATPAALYFLAAHSLRATAFFKQQALFQPQEVAADDPRFQALLHASVSGKNVLDIGCGSGRFLNQLRAQAPEIKGYGIDILPENLTQLPETTPICMGQVENILFPDHFFDTVFVCETLRFSQNLERAIQEIIRVAHPGGSIIIVDKNLRKITAPETVSWEKGLSNRRIRKLLAIGGCKKIRCHPISVDEQSVGKRLLIWQARKADR